VNACIVLPSLSAGGAERAASELATSLAAHEWMVIIATLDGAGSDDFYAVDPRVVRVRLALAGPTRGLREKLSSTSRRIAKLRRLFAEQRPHVILAFLETTNVLCLMAARGLGVPVVVAERTDPRMHRAVPLPWRLGRWLLYRRAAAVVAQTESVASWLRHHCHTQVEVIPNALRALPPAAHAREPLVLSVGRLDRAKGFDVVLRAFALVQSAFPSWRLAIVGEGPEGPALRRLAIELGLTGRVDWPGQQHGIEAWFGRAAVVAQGSRYEGFPNVLLEAMGMGAAVVATDCRSGPRELITSGIDGILVPVDDIEAMAAALRLLLGDTRLRERLGASAQAVRERYSAVQVMGHWRQLLTHCIQGTLPE
jgi:glycosyltransferase involved in cell wall biosynthesis